MHVPGVEIAMSARGVLATLVLTLLAVVLAPVAPVSAGTLPDASVRVADVAREGPRDTIIATVWGRCAPGFEFQDLEVEFLQDGLSRPPSFGQPFPCDGEWHRQTVWSLEADFHPGRATVTARLSVTDAETGDPGQQAVVTKDIWVRAAAAIRLPATATLTPHRLIRLTVAARCDRPWVLSDFLISATQDGNFGGVRREIPCDGDFHRRTVWLRSGGTPFHRGTALVDASVSLLDPEFFDPVTTATASRSVTVQ